MMTKNPQELKDEILRRLGAPIINVEVTTEQIYDCIQRALELFGEYHYDGLNKAYMSFYVGTDEVYKDGVFDLKNENVFAISKILRTNVGSIVSMDGNATYPWVTDFIMGMTGFNGGNSCNKAYGPNAFGADLSYYTMIMQYWSMLQNMLSPMPDFWFNDSTGQLKVMGNFKKGDVIVCEVWVKSYVDVKPSIGAYAGYGYAGNQQSNAWTIGDVYNNADRQLTGYYAGENTSLKQGSYNNRWVKDYATCLVKELNGQILAKHQGLQLAGGVTVDGIRLIEETREEKLRLREELESMDPPVGILIG